MAVKALSLIFRVKTSPDFPKQKPYDEVTPDISPILRSRTILKLESTTSTEDNRDNSSRVQEREIRMFIFYSYYNNQKRQQMWRALLSWWFENHKLLDESF